VKSLEDFRQSTDACEQKREKGSAYGTQADRRSHLEHGFALS
jgi:hypothetical protein